MTAWAPNGLAWRSRWPVLCVVMAAGAASAGEFAPSSDVEARVVPRADAAAASSNAQPKGTGFAVPRHVIAGGGGRSTGAAFAITGTIGQADADPLQPSTGGVFAITGGFWPGIAAGEPQGDPVFVNGFESTAP